MNIVSPFYISPVTSDAETSHTFSPAFVYAIFGENEQIFGYRDLAIKLYFASGSLKNYLDISYLGDKLAGEKALDIEGTLYEYIPSGKDFGFPVFVSTWAELRHISGLYFSQTTQRVSILSRIR